MPQNRSLSEYDWPECDALMQGQYEQPIIGAHESRKFASKGCGGIGYRV